jgi:hypothetical protein
MTNILEVFVFIYQLLYIFSLYYFTKEPISILNFVMLILLFIYIILPVEDIIEKVFGISKE